MLIRLSLPLIASLLLAGCASHTARVGEPAPKQRAESVRTLANITYTPTDWPQALQGDLHLPTGLSQPRPAVLLVHGGGWERRTRADMDGMAAKLAKRGYAVFNISHRFAPQWQFPAQVDDLAQAVRWLKAHSREHGLDPNRIAGWGYSSGAHLVAMLGTLSPGNAHYPGDDTRLQAMVLGGTPADLRKYDGGRLVPQFLGATQAQNFTVYEQASPTWLVSPDDPPTFLYHGGLDLLVRPEHAREMKAALDAAGVPAELYIAQLREHATMFVLGGGAEKAGMAFLDRVLSRDAN